MRLPRWPLPAIAVGVLLAFPQAVVAQTEVHAIPPAPQRAEGEGPWRRLILRGATLVDGTGAPPVGPVDIVVEGNRIKDVKIVGAPGAPIDEAKRPKLEAGDHELDLAGQYVLPGFVDLHGHMGGYEQGTPAEYVLKLWMGHGITTACDPGSGNGLDFMVEHKKKSDTNQITAPRLKPYVTFGQGVKEPIIRPRRRARSCRTRRGGAPTGSSSSACGPT